MILPSDMAPILDFLTAVTHLVPPTTNQSPLTCPLKLRSCPPGLADFILTLDHPNCWKFLEVEHEEACYGTRTSCDYRHVNFIDKTDFGPSSPFAPGAVADDL